MQEKESIMAVRCKLKIPSLGITVWHHSASLVMPNSYPHDGIFSQHLMTSKDSYILAYLTGISVWVIIARKMSYKMSPVKRICVFEHSVMTNFNCACPAIQRGQWSGFLSEGSSQLTACMSEQRRFWRDCADAQARLNLRCLHRR